MTRVNFLGKDGVRSSILRGSTIKINDLAPFNRCAQKRRVHAMSGSPHGRQLGPRKKEHRSLPGLADPLSGPQGKPDHGVNGTEAKRSCADA